MADKIVGDWKNVESSNMYEVLKEMGIDYFTRSIAAYLKPTLKISRVGDSWTIATETTWRSSILQFTLGKQFVEKRLDGSECNSVVTIQGDRMVHKQDTPYCKNGSIERWVEGDYLYSKIVCNRVQAFLKYARVKYEAW